MDVDRRGLTSCRGSAPHREHQVGDPVTLDAERGVAERHVLQRELAEERTALPHHDRYQVDGHLVEQPEFQALPSDGSGRDRDRTVARESRRLVIADVGSGSGGEALGLNGLRLLANRAWRADGPARRR